MIFIQSTSVSWIYLANPPSQLIHPGNSPRFFIPGFSTQVINPGFQTQVLIPGFCNLGNKPGFHTQVLEPGLLTLVCKTQVSKPRCQLWIANIFNGMIVHMHRTKSCTIWYVRKARMHIKFRFDSRGYYSAPCCGIKPPCRWEGHYHHRPFAADGNILDETDEAGLSSSRTLVNGSVKACLNKKRQSIPTHAIHGTRIICEQHQPAM